MGFTVEDVLQKSGKLFSFPQSVIGFFKGVWDSRRGFPQCCRKSFKDEKPFTDRPDAHLETV